MKINTVFKVAYLHVNKNNHKLFYFIQVIFPDTCNSGLILLSYLTNGCYITFQVLLKILIAFLFSSSNH